MKLTAPRIFIVSLVSFVLMAGCTTGGTSPSVASPTLTAPTQNPPAASPSTGPTTEPSDKPTFEVKQQGSDGPEITIFIFDPSGSLTAARGATEQDEKPFIETEVEPRIGAVPGAPNVLRVLWGGLGCDTNYTVWIGTNELGGPYVDVSQGPPSHPVCDTLGIRRGVVLTFSSPVDATKATGALHSWLPQ